MIILVLNCGSSSIKYQLFDMTSEVVMAKGIAEKIGLKGSFLKHEMNNGQKIIFDGEILDHKIGIEYILGVITSEKYGCLKDLSQIDAVGHRVAHGGETFKASAFLDEDAIQRIEACAELAPLHNPANLKGIYAMKELISGIPQAAGFDTSFHQTMPPHSFMYGIPYSLYKKYGIRRYGFHGTSHRYVANRACEVLDRDIKTQKIITCHLGNGASIAALKYGISVDTSMGFTPLEGLIMGTRAGDLDIGAVMYIMEKEEIDLNSANTLFNKHSGMLGVTGISSDMREIELAAEKGNERAILGLEMYDYKVKKYIGSYAAALEGLDIVIFTGGIGENSDIDRTAICKGLGFLGFEIDENMNKNLRGKEAVISTKESKVKVMVVPTNEELMIALDTQKIVEERNN
jgi:acetate kinase